MFYLSGSVAKLNASIRNRRKCFKYFSQITTRSYEEMFGKFVQYKFASLCSLWFLHHVNSSVWLSFLFFIALGLLILFYLYLCAFQALHDTGNEDMCYYNFECAHPLGVFTAFNNIISNIGYVMLGLLFLGLTARRYVKFIFAPVVQHPPWGHFVTVYRELPSPVPFASKLLVIPSVKSKYLLAVVVVVVFVDLVVLCSIVFSNAAYTGSTSYDTDMLWVSLDISFLCKALILVALEVYWQQNKYSCLPLW